MRFCSSKNNFDSIKVAIFGQCKLRKGKNPENVGKDTFLCGCKFNVFRVKYSQNNKQANNKGFSPCTLPFILPLVIPCANVCTD